jgi:hypothetical protein
VLSVMLHQRGLLVLHAGAVEIAGQAVVFLGNKVWGKSTMVAALYGRGHRLIADDSVAISVSDTDTDPPFVLPGFPQLKLWPDSATTSLGTEAASLPEIANGVGKRALCTASNFARAELPLRRLYTLTTGDQIRFEQVESRQAVTQLIAYSSNIELMGKQLLRRESGHEHLKRCVALINRTPLYRFERPFDLSVMSDVAKAVEEHVMGKTEHIES